MVRLVNIVITLDKVAIVMPRIEELDAEYIFQRQVFESARQCHISFKAKDKHLQYVLEKIQELGCGVMFGQIDVLSVVLSKPPIEAIFNNFSATTKKTRAYRISDRMTIDEIAAFIDDGNHLTFNYLAQLTMAALIAGAGLLGDSATTVIASMLVSPLMGPILSITFGLAVGDVSSIRKGLRNEFAGICIAMITGMFMGIIASSYYSPDYRSDEMSGRGEASGLLYGFVVAFASGIAVVVAISMGGVNAIVGTAISASLLPPIVNSGLCLAMALKFRFANQDHQNAADYAVFGAVSFALFTLNFLVIVIVGFITFRFVKDVKPSDKTTDLERFSATISDLHDDVRSLSDTGGNGTNRKSLNLTKLSTQHQHFPEDSV